MSKTFCVFPFFNLNSNTDGSVKLCCNIRTNTHVKDHKGNEFNLGKDCIDAIWYSSYMNDVRRNMMDGIEISECRDCYRQEELTGQSSRTSSNKFWLKKDHVQENINQFKDHKKLNPLSSLELRLGNTCNLSCNSCWGYSSSKVNEERIQIMSKNELDTRFKNDWSSEYKIPSEINKWFKTPQYEENINSVSNTLNRLYITGGEPTLIKENRTLLQKLLDNGNKDCFVSFTTNGTQADGELLDLLKEFPNNEIQISIDGIGDQAHYVRYPTIWEEFKHNVDKLCSIPNVNIIFYTVISAYNLCSIQDILKYVDSIAKHRKVGWYPIFLDNPDYLHTHIWPRQFREIANIKLKATIMRLENLPTYVSKDVFDMLHQYLTSDVDQSHNLANFKKFNEILDNKRGTDFNKTFPELCLN